jgi:hypothetical protein
MLQCIKFHKHKSVLKDDFQFREILGLQLNQASFIQFIFSLVTSDKKTFIHRYRLRDNLEDLCVDRKMILKYVSVKESLSYELNLCGT